MNAKVRHPAKMTLDSPLVRVSQGRLGRRFRHVGPPIQGSHRETHVDACELNLVAGPVYVEHAPTIGGIRSATM